MFLGFLPPRGGKDLIDLRSGVEAFETSIGLRPTGAITEDLIDTLARAVQSKGASNNH